MGDGSLKKDEEVRIGGQQAWAGLSLTDPGPPSRQRLRPERGAESPRESERGWGPASIDKG